MSSRMSSKMSSRMSSRMIIIAILTCFGLTACSEVELCDSTHPHQTQAKFLYEWGDNETSKPDTMGVLMYRVVNKWSQLAEICTYNGADTTTILPGEYKFITFPLNGKEFGYSDVDRFINEKGADFTLHDIGINYKEYAISDPELKKGLAGWDDYNSYARYIQPDVDIMFYDSTQMMNVYRDQNFTHTFHPQALSQNIDIYFDIKKDVGNRPFVIDSVWAEISGIPRHLNLRNGYLDITKTSKMMFKTDITAKDGTNADYDDNTSLRCHGNINVSGIVNVQKKPGESETDVLRKLYGPGIMQVIIFSRTKDRNGKTVRRKWQGIINLYRPIAKADLTIISPDGGYVKRKNEHGIIDITSKLTIDGDKIITNVSGDDPFGGWIPTSSIILDI